MTKTKKLFAFLMAALLALPMFCTTAFAANPPTHTFVVKKDLGEHTEWADKTNKDSDGNPSYYDYKLFQMFTGTITTVNGTKVLGDVEWGASVPTATQEYMYTFCKLDGTEGKEKTAQKVADTLASTGDTVFHQILQALQTEGNDGYEDGSLLTEFSKKLEYGTYNGVKGFGVEELPEGYYFIRNDLIPTGVEESYSDYMVIILDGDLIQEPKSGTLPTSEKTVKDRNDTLPVAEDLNKTSNIADHDIGDKITYKLTATLPSNFAAYDVYELTFLDNLSKGLTYNNDAKIYYGRGDTTGTSINLTSAAYAGTDARYAGGTSYTYTIPNLKDASLASYNLNASELITIEYTATLNADAVVGVAGNPNEYTIQFSNNPSNKNSKSTTPPNTAIVLTYKLVFNKVDDSKSPLTGADFDLYKFVTDNDGKNGAWIKVSELNSGDKGSGSNINPAKTVSDNGTVKNSVFTFAGLDDGDYKLVETETPAGYNSINDVYFNVSASHVLNSDGTVSLTLSGAQSSTYGTSATITLSNYAEDNKTTGLSAQIVNPSGSKLPDTGGIGTTIFYIVGGTLMAVSAVAFVTKRRMHTSA